MSHKPNWKSWRISQLSTSRAEETIDGVRSGHHQKGKMTEGHTTLVAKAQFDVDLARSLQLCGRINSHLANADISERKTASGEREALEISH
jgi:hypothetical protein